VGKKLWRGIQQTFHAIGLAETFVLLALFYFLILGPVALIARVARRDFLGLKGRGRDSFWRKRPPEQISLERARRQS
jgi:hypothetical protein